MAFRIVEGVPSVKWFQIAYGATCYLGQIVKHVAEGVTAIGAEGSAIPSTASAFGIVVGFNVGPGYESFDTTYGSNKLAGVATQALVNAREPYFVEGMWPKSTRVPMAKVAVIDKTSVIEGPIRYSALSAGPQVVTCDGVDTNGLSSMTHSALTVATVANNNMYYGRTG